MDSTIIYHISTYVGFMSYNDPPFSSSTNNGPTPFSAASYKLQMESQSIYNVSMFVGSTYINHFPFTYGINNGCNTNPFIPLPSSMVVHDTPSTNSHGFHLDEDILEAMTNLNYSWGNLHNHSHFLPQDDFTT